MREFYDLGRGGKCRGTNSKGQPCGARLSWNRRHTWPWCRDHVPLQWKIVRVVVLMITVLAWPISLVVDVDSLLGILNRQSEFAGNLRPDDIANPPHHCNDRIGDDFAVLAGGSAYFFSAPVKNLSLLKISGEPVVQASMEHGELMVSATIKSADGRIVASIQNNHFEINRNNYFRLDRPDSSRLIVFDQLGRNVLDVHYANPKRILFRAIVQHPTRGEIRISDSEIAGRGLMMRRSCFHIAGKDVTILAL